MALIIFRCRDYPDVPMLHSHAKAIFDIIQLPLNAQGVMREQTLHDALDALNFAIGEEADEEQQADHQPNPNKENIVLEDPDDDEPQPKVQLRQRAFPFMQMLKAAMAHHTDIYWGF